MLPSAANIASEAAKVGLRVRDSHAFGLDYARTCRTWCATMLQRRPRIVRLGYDDAFLRGWQFYLEGCAAAFANGRCDVVQVTLDHAEEMA